MRVFIAILVLIFSLQSWTKADDISDFEIEGMSIGDSLLDYMTIDEIKQNTLQYWTDKRKYYVVAKIDNLKLFEQVELYIKTNDKNYEIKTILAGFFIDDLNTCFKRKKKIEEDIGSLFSGLKKLVDTKSNEADTTGNSKQYITQYNFDSKNHIRIECVKWSNEMKQDANYNDTLNLIAMTGEIWDWIGSGYQ